MKITSHKLGLKISLVKTDHLRPHEEVIQSSAKVIAEQILAEGRVRDPLIVDQRDHVILDGTHRFSALNILKCNLAPCCLINYDSSCINVGSWFRIYRVNEDTDSLAGKVLEETQLNHSQRPFEPKDTRHHSETIILTNNTDFQIPDLDQFQRARIAVQVEMALTKVGYLANYLSEKAAIQNLKTDESNFVIAIPVFTKDQIRESGLRGRLLPHKVTRHIIPCRPLCINSPLELLKQSNVSEANSELEKLLSKREVERKPPGSAFDGRLYEEELLVFSQ